MARIRCIKPELPHSESMGRVSREARLCFILLWTIADDAGRLRGNSRMLASLLYPYDDDSKKHMNGWLNELAKENCIIRYGFKGADYIEIANWLLHQKIDKPSKSKIPSPREVPSVTIEDSTNIREDSRSVVVGSKDMDLDQGMDPDPDLDQGMDLEKSSKLDSVDSVVNEIFNFWKSELNHQNSRLDAVRTKNIKARLKEGYSLERIKLAIMGIKKSPHHMGQNDRSVKYDDIELICRSGANIDKFADMEISNPPQPTWTKRYTDALLPISEQDLEDHEAEMERRKGFAV